MSHTKYNILNLNNYYFILTQLKLKYNTLFNAAVSTIESIPGTNESSPSIPNLFDVLNFLSKKLLKQYYLHSRSNVNLYYSFVGLNSS